MPFNVTTTLGRPPPAAAGDLGHKSVMDKQRAAIEKLRAQNAKLKEELLLENKFSMRPSDPAATQTVNKLQDEADHCTRKIQLQHRKVLMLQQQLGQAQEELGSSRQAMGGLFSARQKEAGLAKQIQLLEDRLEKSYIKYNEAVTYTRGVRDTVDNLRRERITFEAINAGLSRDLERTKSDIRDTIEAVNEAAGARDKALAEAAALQLQMEREHAASEEEWRQLTGIIEDDKKQRDVLRAEELAERERRTQELLKSTEMSAAAAAARKRLSGPGASGGGGGGGAAAAAAAASSASARDVSRDRVRMYEEWFEKIKAATGMPDIEQLVAAFAAREEANHARFTFMNEVSDEVEKLEDAVSAMSAELRSMQAQAHATESAARSGAADAAARLRRAAAAADAGEARVGALLRLMAQLRGRIQRLFHASGCNTAAVRHLLGPDGLVNEDNMLGYLGVLELRCNELLQAYARSKGGPQAAQLQAALRAQPLAAPQHRIVIDPPSSHEHVPSMSAGLEGFGEEEAEPLPDDQPLTREALKAKVSRRLDTIVERSLRVRAQHASGGRPPKQRP